MTVDVILGATFEGSVRSVLSLSRGWKIQRVTGIRLFIMIDIMHNGAPVMGK